MRDRADDLVDFLKWAVTLIVLVCLGVLTIGCTVKLMHVMFP